MATRALTADLPEELADKVDELEEKRHRLTLEGLADVDAGRLIDDAEVEAWIKSLETDHPLTVPTPH